MAGKNRFGTSEASLERHETYRSAFRISAFANLVMGAGAAASILIAYWAISSQPEPRYFATREDGGIIPLVAVSQPFLSEGQVTNFAVEAITASMTLDFLNYRADLDRAGRYFQRPEGWENFLEALNEARILEYVETRSFVTNAVANGATIVRSGIDPRGRYSWVVQVPLTITYESSSERSVENLLAEIVVTRVPTWESSDAVGITRVTMRPGRM